MPRRRRKCHVGEESVICVCGAKCDCVWACLKRKMKELEQLILRPTFNVLIFTFSYSDFYCITFSQQKWRFREDTKQGRVCLKLTVIDNRYCWKRESPLNVLTVLIEVTSPYCAWWYSWGSLVLLCYYYGQVVICPYLYHHQLHVPYFNIQLSRMLSKSR